MANVYNKPIIVIGGGGVELPVDNGPIYEGKYRVRYFDIDGKILKIEYVAEGGKLTPPSNPNYDPDYLIFDEWNYDIENYIVEQPTDVGAIYKTVDDATYMFCRFTTNTGLNPTIKVTNFTYIDWGDGTIDTNTSHTYANEGEYIIKIYGDINITVSSGQNLMGSNTLNKVLQKIYIKNSVTSIGTETFRACFSLKIITIPKSVTSINASVFFGCTGLKSITIPEGIAKINDQMFYDCESLESVIMPKSVTSIGSDVFFGCTGLKSITIPEGIAKINDQMFYDCKSLESVIMPKRVTSIGGNAFSSCYSITNYFMNFDTIPTLLNTNAFKNINKATIFWIKDSIFEQLKVATNWSAYASYMKPLSWYPSLTDPNA